MTGFYDTPPHIGYDSWELSKGYDPELLLAQLDWILDCEKRRASAIAHMQPILGFNALVVALDNNPETGKVNSSVQLNFYTGSNGNDESVLTEKPHAHSKDAFATWYAPTDASQIITRFNVLRSDEVPLPGIKAEQRLVVANFLHGFGDARRAHYRPMVLGETAVSILSRSHIHNGSSTFFSSAEVHSVATDFPDKATLAISVHFKSGVESESFSTREGLVRYKKLTEAQADQVLGARRAVNGYFGPVTMMYPLKNGYDEELLREYPKNTDPVFAEKLLLKGRALVAMLCRV